MKRTFRITGNCNCDCHNSTDSSLEPPSKKVKLDEPTDEPTEEPTLENGLSIEFGYSNKILQDYVKRTEEAKQNKIETRLDRSINSQRVYL